MERLQALLKDYICNHPTDFETEEWTKSYSNETFPSYWKVVYTIAEKLPRNLDVLEIGAGFGFVTSIFEHLGFNNITAYEQDIHICKSGNLLLSTLFKADNVIKPLRFVSQMDCTDIVVLVNCAYPGNCRTKEEYKSTLRSYYENCNHPQYYILEVIDSSYTIKDDVFPDYIRLSSEDIKAMFPSCKIQSWETYKYPINKKSKTLYLIEKL